MDTDKIYAQSVANEYAPKGTSKVIALKKLDRKAKLPSNIFAHIFGAIGILLLGIGMCLCMQVIGPDSAATVIAGIITGIIGIAAMGVNYPIYKVLRERGKKKYAFEIVELARQITDGQ